MDHSDETRSKSGAWDDTEFFPVFLAFAGGNLHRCVLTGQIKLLPREETVPDFDRFVAVQDERSQNGRIFVGACHRYNKCVFDLVRADLSTDLCRCRSGML